MKRRRNMKVWYPLIVYLAVQSITPGPNNLTCLYLGATYGLKGAKRFIIASMTALAAKTFLCGGLNVVLAKYIPVVAEWLKWIGALYMLYLAFVMARSGWVEEGGSDNQFSGSTFRDGITLQILNGKSWVVAVSMFAVYVIPVSSKFSAIVFATVVFIFLAAACSVIWAAFGEGLRRFIARYRKPFGIVMGLSLVWCAVTAVL